MKGASCLTSGGVVPSLLPASQSPAGLKWGLLRVNQVQFRSISLHLWPQERAEPRPPAEFGSSRSPLSLFFLLLFTWPM